MQHPVGIKNIIFDFGGVIINIDYRLTIRSFLELGFDNFEEQYSKMKQSHLFDEFEKGLITPEAFRNRIRETSKKNLSDKQIDDAWNSILINLPEENIRFLGSLKGDYQLFLLSNTNEIHEQAFSKMILEQFGEDVLRKTFKKVYLSHHMKMRKPDPEIFEYVLKENNLLAAETLFVDDSPQHIEGGRKVGLKTFYFENGKTLGDLFLALDS